MVVMWGCCPLGHERSPHLHSFFALHGSSIALFLSFLLYIILRTVSIGFPEFSHQFDVILSIEVGPWKLPLLVAWSEVWVTWTTWLASDVRILLIPQPVALAMTPQIWSQKSIDSGAPTGYWKLDGVGAETISLQSGKTPDSPCLVIWGLTWGLGSWVVRVGHCI